MHAQVNQLCTPNKTVEHFHFGQLHKFKQDKVWKRLLETGMTMYKLSMNRGGVLKHVLASRTHFEVLGLELKALGPRKLPCSRLEDSTIFEPLKFRWKTSETSQKIWKTFFLFFSRGDRLKKNFCRPSQ